MYVYFYHSLPVTCIQKFDILRDVTLFDYRRFETTYQFHLPESSSQKCMLNCLTLEDGSFRSRSSHSFLSKVYSDGSY